MITNTCRPLKTFSAIFQWHSLKTKVTISTLAIFVIAIWTLAFFASRMLHEEMEHISSEQQFSTVSFIASDLNEELATRLKGLETYATVRITPAVLKNAAAMQTRLEESPTLKGMFTGGLFVTNSNGITIASVPPPRIGTNFMDREYIIAALKEGKSTISKPLIGRVSKIPNFVMAVPIRDVQGKAIGVLVGNTELDKPNFLDKLTNNKYGKTGGYLLVAAQYRMIITATDKRRVMTNLPAPAPGVIPANDRFIQGFEGTATYVNPLGIEVQTSAKGIPVAGWVMMATLPTEEAFAPIHTIQKRMLMIAVFLTLLAGVLTWWMLKCQLAPIFTAITTLATLTDTPRNPQPLPITSQDEIGELIGAFNRLLNNLGQREESLRVSMERFTTIFEQAPLGMGVIDSLTGLIYEANSKYAEIAGRARSEMTQLTWMSITHPDDVQADLENMALLNAGQITGYDMDKRYVRPEGTVVWVHMTIAPLKTVDQCHPCHIAMIEDITSRLHAEEALWNAAQEWSNCFDAMSDGVSIHDADYTILKANRKLCQLIDRREEEIIGKKCYSIFHGIDNPLACCPIELTRKTQKEEQVEIFEPALNKWLFISTSPVFDDAGQLKRIVHVVSDITSRKHLEEERQVMSERLQRAEKMESLGTLAGGVAHDLNNVLGVLSGYSEILVEQIPEGSPLKMYAANILKSSEKGAAIIQDLLTLARRGVAVDKVVNLNGVIADYLATPECVRLKTYHPLVTITTDLEQDLLHIKGSPVHLEKTVMNLVSNATEAIHGSGAVNIRTENRYVDHAISGYDQVGAGDYVILTVADTGGGISSSDLGKIFEPFYTKKTMGRSGTGLGLAIVWGTVKDHNGYIDVQSTEGEGTTFTLYFPVTREEMAEVVQKVPIEQYFGQGESVLVVDDVQEQRQVATTILTQLGYQVNSVSSGREALAYLQSNKVDILVLDMIMDPGIDGLDTYKHIIDVNPHQKAILVSGFSETDRVQEALRLGAGAYVKKPYLKEKIGVAIRDELVRK